VATSNAKRTLLALLFSLGLALSGKNCNAQTCDKTLWKHTYKPERLKVLAPCVTFRGVIVDATHGKRKDGVRKEADGDTHGWLHLDKGQEKYLNKGNMDFEDGNLVFEIVCRFPVSQADAKAACKNYKNTVNLPPVGTHVAMTCPWVQDDNHAHWNECHPVSEIAEIVGRP
jgi:hypothetical protein